MMRGRRVAALAAMALTVWACADLTIEAAVDQIQVPIDSASFRKDIYPVLKETCASSAACHFGPGAPAAPQVTLDMSSDSAAYANLVNVVSQRRSPLMRVLPGKADSSFMFLVLSDTASVRLGYYRMPLTRYQLPLPLRLTIKNWINKGALYN